MTSSKKFKSAAIFFLFCFFAVLIVIIVILMAPSKSEGAPLYFSATSQENASSFEKSSIFGGISLNAKNPQPITINGRKIEVICLKYFVYGKEFFSNRIKIQLTINGIFINFEGIVGSDGIYRINPQPSGIIFKESEENKKIIEEIRKYFEEVVNSNLKFFLESLN